MTSTFVKTLLPLTAFGCVQGNAATPKKQQRPNIIYIMCDDMGYGDLGCYGQQYILTPNIDRMAKEGMRFTQAYAGAPVSAPSRACFMTGQHSGHTEVRGNKEYWPTSKPIYYGKNRDFSVVGQHPYDPEHVILPEIMKEQGYRTGMFGKWAGGFEGSASTPDKRGVDDFYGYICQFQAHLYYPNFLNEYSKERGDSAVRRVVMQNNIDYPMFGKQYAQRKDYSADLIHQHAMNWLKRQSKDKPFFGVFTYTLPHAELAQPNDSLLAFYKKKFFEDKTWGGQEASRYNAVVHTHAQFAAMISRLDAYVGEVLHILDEQELAENTLVIFTSDNGPHEEGGADPEFFNRDGKLRGLKRQCYEGGIRIPFIARWKGRIQANATNNLPFAFYDLMPTFCDVAGVHNFPKRYINKKKTIDYFDGISIFPTLINDEKAQKKHTYLYWEFAETDQIAVRMDDWKLIVIRGVPHLYNLATDLHEDKDIAKEHPEIVDKMINIIYQEHIDNPLFPITLPIKRK
ncbi:arylsulfatase [Prevotella sp.]